MTLKTPICPQDTLSNHLCIVCQAKLKKNMITELDVKVAQSIGKLSKNFPIAGVEFKKAIDLEQLIVLACTGNMGALIGSKSHIVAELTKLLGKKTRIIEYTKNEKKMAQDLIGNARVLGLKKIFAPGFTEYQIIVPEKDKKMLAAPKQNLENGLKELFKTKTTIIFE